MRGLETTRRASSSNGPTATAARAQLALTPEVYARLRGPYNRRNVYGAVLAYGPVLATDAAAAAAVRAVARYALCGDAPLLRELGIDPADVDGRRASATSRCRSRGSATCPRCSEVPCRMSNGWTGGQYSVFRALFGLYLCVHFAQLLPWGAELFSRHGMLPDASASPLSRLFPNVLTWLDAPWP